jgi:hypothetical protein
MKNIILVIAIFVFTLVANVLKANPVALTGDSQTKFGTYQITPSSNIIVIDDVAYKTWELSYSGTQEKYQLFIVPGSDRNCCYIVRSKGFEIKYTIETGVFGAKLVDQNFKTISRKELMKKINQESLLTQEVISTTPKSENEYLGLIACFMPLLEKE